MEKLRNILNVLSMKVYGDQNKRQCAKNVAMSLIVCLSAGIMLIMNIIRHSTLMTITSVILVAGFAVTGVLAGVFKSSAVSSALMAVILTGVFTVFPISGGNEGFAVLWLLLIPLFSISLFGVKIGIAMNTYFIMLIIFLFYTPLNKFICDLYTSNFMNRFPVLFLADSFTAQFLALGSEYYYRTTRLQLYTDDMTGVFNRKYFIELLDKNETPKGDICITVIDVNGLKTTNDTLGHSAGDELIRSVPIFVKKAFGNDVILSRMGGDEFAILTYGSRNETEEKVSMMKSFAESHKGNLINEVFLSAGIACRSDFPDLTPEGLYQKADKFMYDDKSEFYSRKGHDRRRK